MRYLITGARPPSTKIEVLREIEESDHGRAKMEIDGFLQRNRVAFLRVWVLDNLMTHDAWESSKGEKT